MRRISQRPFCFLGAQVTFDFSVPDSITSPAATGLLPHFDGIPSGPGHRLSRIRIHGSYTSFFLASTIPNIKLDATILALCGVIDIGEANPELDSWSFSDLFPFNYLLKGDRCQPNIAISYRFSAHRTWSSGTAREAPMRGGRLS
jgi:hypothetical protein